MTTRGIVNHFVTRGALEHADGSIILYCIVDGSDLHTNVIVVVVLGIVLTTGLIRMKYSRFTARCLPGFAVLKHILLYIHI